MKIEQFEDKELSHYSYTIWSESENKVILIDPSRDIEPYLAFAKQHEAKIIGVIETHPHADFVSGHLELHHTTGAIIYCSRLLGATYPHQTFDDGDAITFGKIKLNAINTPGHSPDSISILLKHEGKNKAVFTGDTLFIGDCGRPDLRENAGKTMKREELAKLMYHTLRNKFMILDNDVLVYPAHGAGTLCGKALRDANSSTIGAERSGNWALQEMSEEQFVTTLLQDQPFTPKYFPYDVELNKRGVKKLSIALNSVPQEKSEEVYKSILIIDTRTETKFKKGHLPGSINLQNSGKFETWLGSIIAPQEAFYLVADNKYELNSAMIRCAKIGYEAFIKYAFIFNQGAEKMDSLDIQRFKTHISDYTIVDIRNHGEAKDHSIFNHSIAIPLYELRERVMEIPENKPVVVHCAGGYRSAAGSSIIKNFFKKRTEVYDLGESVKEFL